MTAGVLPLVPCLHTHTTPARCVDLPTVHSLAAGSLPMWCVTLLPFCFLQYVSVVRRLQNPCKLHPSRPLRATAAHSLASMPPSTSGVGALLPVLCFFVLFWNRCIAASGWMMASQASSCLQGGALDLRGSARRPSLLALPLAAAPPIGACDVVTGALD